MSDDKKGWLHSDIYNQSIWPEIQTPRTSIFKFGSFGDLIRNALKILGQSLIAWFLFIMLLIFLLDPAMRTNDEYFLAVDVIIRLICSTISVFLAIRVFDDSNISDMGLKLDHRAFRDFLVGFTLVAFVMGFEFVTDISQGWVRIEHTAWDSQSFAGVLWNTLAILVIFVFVGWAEELLSRGFHLRIISKGLNRPLGIILSSAIFSYLHHNNPDMSTRGYIFIFLFGIVCAMAFLRTGQLWLAMGIHAGWDFFVAVLWGTPISGLRIFHLMDINYGHYPFWFPIFEFINLLVIAIFIHLYTSHRKPKIQDW